VQAMMLRHLRRTIYHASRVASAFILRFWPSGTAFFDVSAPDVMERRTNVMTGAGPMTWNRRYQVKSYLRSALWVVPLVALTLEQVFWALVRILDYRFAWKGLALGVTGAEAVFNAVTTLTLSFIVFTFGSLLVAIQVAVGQYTPRIIATTLLRDNVIRYTGPFRLHVHFRGQGCGPNGDDRSPISRVRHRAPWLELHRSVPVFDRLRSENAAPGQFGEARRRERTGGDRERVS
jgi:hypothetical protein